MYFNTCAVVKSRVHCSSLPLKSILPLPNPVSDILYIQTSMASPHVQESYKVPPLDPNSTLIIDISCLHKSPVDRSRIIESIRRGCTQFGFFHIVNHGIGNLVIDDTLNCASRFFNLPMEEKNKFFTDDIKKPVRCVADSNRESLKMYSWPLRDWVDFWPQKPFDYREKMGKYLQEVREVAMELLTAIMESLRLPPNYLKKKLEDGLQFVGINNYLPCPHPENVLGIQAHTDHGIVTILLQSCPGLQLIDSGVKEWRAVPELHGALQVLVGNHLEVLSNGLYKSVMHRATPSSSRTRLSIATIHSLAIDEIMEPAKELVDEDHPKGYKECSFQDFLNYLSSSDIKKKTFIESLMI